MKQLYFILALSCICMTIHAQIPNRNYLTIDLCQTDFSYTADSTRNDYYPEFNVKQNDYKFVHNADSSYMVGGVRIPFRLTNEEPRFHGGEPTDFCNWIGKKIFDLLENNKEYCFWLTVDFIISSDGEVQDVHVNPYRSDKDVDERAHLEDNSVDLNQWIRSNIQDITVMKGFGDGESEIELIISANGWVSKATVVKSYDPLLGEYLADMLLTSCPRWVPAKVNGICVPSKMRLSYSWQF